jgi:hypothetical protein
MWIKINFLCVLLISGLMHTQAQISYSDSANIIIKKGCTSNISEIQEDWKVAIQALEMPTPSAGTEKAELKRIKENIPPKIRKYSQPSYRKSGTTPLPILQRNFEGNLFNIRVPNDNDIAISNNGSIISVINSLICFYSEDSVLANPVSLGAFCQDLQLPESKYDPKVLYDPQEDKFIILFLNGYNDSTSYCILAFSESNDPTGNWHLYPLPGNPLNDTSWSDFPMAALSENELFLTLNLLKNDEHWKTGFKQSVIWQIDKHSGYSGASLKTRLYNNVFYEGQKIRNLTPIQGGMKPEAKNLFFISNRNFSPLCDSFFIVEISGEQDDPKTELQLKLAISDQAYGVPPSADQPNNRKFETNDARILNGFINNNSIHCVGNTINPKNNRASIFHAIIDKASQSPKVELNIIDHDFLEFGYPNIEFTGAFPEDNEAIIIFNHSSDSIYPGVSSLYYKEGIYSEITTVKEGETYVSVQTGMEQRWGDYTGLQRKYNDTGIVWGSAYYGRRKEYTPLNPFTRVNGTWIFEIQSPGNHKMPTKTQEVKIIPNPAYRQFAFQFHIPVDEVLDFVLYDVRGRAIKHLLRNHAKSGDNVFTFSLDPLKPGIYFLVVSNNKTKLFREKIMIQ